MIEERRSQTAEMQGARRRRGKTKAYSSARYSSRSVEASGELSYAALAGRQPRRAKQHELFKFFRMVKT